MNNQSTTAMPATPTDKTSRIRLDHVILATDFSQSSAKAVSYVLDLVRHFGATAEIVQAIRMNVAESASQDARERAVENARQLAAGHVPQFARELAGVEHRFLIDPEDAVQRLTWIFKRQEPSLVAVAAPVRSGETLVLDPRIEVLISVARSPRLMFGPLFVSSRMSEHPLTNILFACDLTPDSLAAGRYAMSFAQEFQARLVLLNVLKAEVAQISHVGDTVARTHRWVEERIRDEARLWAEPSTIVEFGETVERILHVAQREEADLIVMGWDINKYLTSLGKVARPVIEGSPCPVLLVPRNL